MMECGYSRGANRMAQCTRCAHAKRAIEVPEGSEGRILGMESSNQSVPPETPPMQNKRF